MSGLCPSSTSARRQPRSWPIRDADPAINTDPERNRFCRGGRRGKRRRALPRPGPRTAEHCHGQSVLGHHADRGRGCPGRGFISSGPIPSRQEGLEPLAGVDTGCGLVPPREVAKARGREAQNEPTSASPFASWKGREGNDFDTALLISGDGTSYGHPVSQAPETGPSHRGRLPAQADQGCTPKGRRRELRSGPRPHLRQPVALNCRRPKSRPSPTDTLALINPSQIPSVFGRTELP